MKFNDLFEAAWWERLTNPDEKDDIEYVKSKSNKTITHSGRPGDETTIQKKKATKQKASTPSAPTPSKTSKSTVKKPEQSMASIVQLSKRYPKARREITISVQDAMKGKGVSFSSSEIPNDDIEKVKDILGNLSKDNLYKLLALLAY